MNISDAARQAALSQGQALQAGGSGMGVLGGELGMIGNGLSPTAVGKSLAMSSGALLKGKVSPLGV